MMRITDQHKIDVAVFPQAVSASGTTSAYFDMKGYSSAAFMWSVLLHSAGLTTTSVATIYQAMDGSAATSATALASTTGTITASGKLIQIVITPAVASLSEGDTFTLTSYDVLGVARAARVYTLTAANTADVSISGGVTMGLTASSTGFVSTICTYAASVVNAAGMGVYGSATASTITFRPLNAGETTFLFTASDTTAFTITNAYVGGIIEVKASALTISSSFTHLAINIVNESAYYTSAFIVRRSRKSRAQQLAAITTLD